MNHGQPAPTNPSEHRARLDRWLWAARFFRTRALAKTAIEGGKVLIVPPDAADSEDPERGGQTAKPGKEIGPGVVLVIRRDETVATVRVLAVEERRGSATLARTLFEETPGSVERRERARAQRMLERAGLTVPAARPDKRERRDRMKLKHTLPHPGASGRADPDEAAD